MQSTANTSREELLKSFEQNITLADIKKALPAKFFERSLFKSSLYLAQDLVELAACILLQVFVVNGYLIQDSNHIALQLLGYVLSACIIAYQGVTMTGIWVLAHECGHGAFSPNQLINDIIGFTLHTPLIVPYFAWQKSHKNHHSWTSNIKHDEVWIPDVLEEDIERARELYGGFRPLSAIKSILTMLTVGWPLYLLVNATGHAPFSIDDAMNHFDPRSPIFKGEPAWKIHLSTAGVVSWLSFVFLLVHKYGMFTLAQTYFLPACITFFFLTSLTFLQHTDEKMPFWDDGSGKWSWLKGAVLSTMDRSMGPFMDYKLHYITSSHVCHHIFSKIPFYYAEEATPILAAKLGPYYNRGNSKSFFDFFCQVFIATAQCHGMVRQPGMPEGSWWWFTDKIKAQQQGFCVELARFVTRYEVASLVD